MKTWGLYGTAAALALALGASVGCGASGCSGMGGGTNLNSSAANQAPPLQCGTGTYLDTATHQCLPKPK